MDLKIEKKQNSRHNDDDRRHPTTPPASARTMGSQDTKSDGAAPAAKHIRIDDCPQDTNSDGATPAAKHVRIDDCPHVGPLICEAQEWDEVSSGTSSQDVPTPASSSGSSNSTKLAATFVAFVVSGALFQVSAKLQAISMYNYPNALNVYGCVLFVILCFGYIIPAARYGLIPREQLTASKRPFAIMAVFDTLSSTMQVFSSIYLPGPLLVLLPQASIPISMLMSRLYLKSTYTCWQIMGASIVIGGILVVLEPVMTNRHAPDHVCVAVNKANDCLACEAEMTQEDCEGYASAGDVVSLFESERSLDLGNDTALHTCEWVQSSHETSDTSTLLFWSCILLLSCFPLSMSSIYKERKLSRYEFDPIYLNGWLCLFQTPMSVVLAIPGGILSSPPVTPSELPTNMWDGLKCFLGTGTITAGCHPDDCRWAFVTMVAFTLICFVYVNLMVLLLKFGSANLMFLALTLIVPVANLAFAMPIMPNPVALHDSDILGLVVIMVGIIAYRVGSRGDGHDEHVSSQEEEDACMIERGDLTEPLLSASGMMRRIGLEIERPPSQQGEIQ